MASSCRLIFATILFVVACGSPSAMAANYELIDLGPEISDSVWDSLRDINDRREIVGTLNNQAFYWSDGELKQLKVPAGATRSSANAINNQGNIVGYARIGVDSDSDSIGLLWEDHDAVPEDIGSLGTTTYGNTRTYPRDINDVGEITGYSILNSGGTGAFVWRSGVMEAIGLDIGRAINSAGVVLGEVDTVPAIWQAGTVQTLPTLDGSSVEALSINEFGSVAGYASLPNGDGRAVLWRNGTIQNLGTLGGEASYGRDLNNLGEVVGWAHTSDRWGVAFVWRKGTMFSLCALSDCTSSGWDRLLVASNINNHGDIIGTGYQGEALKFFLAIKLAIEDCDDADCPRSRIIKLLPFIKEQRGRTQ